MVVEKSMNKPNILFAFADDWGRYASAYKEVEGLDTLNSLLNTPNFDRVAEEGVLFTNAFAPAPSCTPCRSSILSGRYFWECGLGAILHGAVWDDSIPSYPLLLEDAGYHIGFSYKAWYPGRPRNAPYGGERTEYKSAGYSFKKFSQNVTQLKGRYGVEGAKEKLLEEVTKNFDTFLQARPEGRPFCYWFGPSNTHREWEKGSGKDLWGLNPDDLKGRLPGYLPDVHEVREDVCDYMGEAMAFDASLGAILDKLESIGELDNTLVVVSGDHGIPGMPRGKCNLYNEGCEIALAVRWPGHVPADRVVDDFVNLMDLAPTFLEAGGVQPPACMSAKSLLPVLTSEKSGQVEPERDFVVIGRERHGPTARDHNLPYPQRAIRTKDHLYIINFAPDRWPAGDPRGLDDPDATPPPYEVLEKNTRFCYADMDASPTKAWMIHHRGEKHIHPLFELGFGKRPREELYDMQNDPDHLHNLAHEPNCKDVIQELKYRLNEELRSHNDPRITEKKCRFENPPYTNERN